LKKIILYIYFFIIIFSINQIKLNSHESKFILKNKIQIDLEVSDTFKKRETGLMHRKFLDKNKGMIFIYDKVEIINIWMYKTNIPLDIIFLKNKNIINLKKNASPCLQLPCESYSSKEPIDTVIEINAGMSDQLKLKIGDNLEIFSGTNIFF
tara:strand:+ start:143 stop:598 length:456 start_codon:yes stop_codon:yes gene_type:complete